MSTSRAPVVLVLFTLSDISLRSHSLMYSDLGRNYIYDIDNWCSEFRRSIKAATRSIAKRPSLLAVGEDLKAQIAVQQALTVSAKTTVDKKKKKGKGKQKQVVVQAPVEDEGYKAVYAIDAFHVGNVSPPLSLPSCCTCSFSFHHSGLDSPTIAVRVRASLRDELSLIDLLLQATTSTRLFEPFTSTRMKSRAPCSSSSLSKISLYVRLSAQRTRATLTRPLCPTRNRSARRSLSHTLAESQNLDFRTRPSTRRRPTSDARWRPKSTNATVRRLVPPVDALRRSAFPLTAR